MFWSFLEFI